MLHWCGKCPKAFQYACQLIGHDATHNKKEKKYKCEVCNSKYSLKDQLKVHLSNHKKPCKCKLCDKCFTTELNLEEHVVRIHKPSLYPLMCKYCGKVYKYQARLDAHVHKHSREKQFHCKQCEKQCSSSAYLQRHIRKYHSQEAQYECLHCGDKFDLQWNLDEHMNVRNTDGNVACSVCDKNCCTALKLQSHLEEHFCIIELLEGENLKLRCSLLNTNVPDMKFLKVSNTEET